MRKTKSDKGLSSTGQNKKESRLSSDILQLFFALIAVFFLLSLISFSSEDPSAFTIVDTDEPIVFNNLFGSTGAWTSAKLGLYFGWSSLLLPFLFGYVSVLLFKYRKGNAPFLSPIAGFFYGMCIVISFSVLSGLIGGKDLYFTMQPAGGLLGVISSTFLVSVMGRVGGILVFLFFLIAFGMLLFSLSFSDMGKGVSIFFGRAGGFFSKLFKRKNKESVAPSPIYENIPNREIPLDEDEAEALKEIEFTAPQEETPIEDTAEPVFKEMHREPIIEDDEEEVVAEPTEPEFKDMIVTEKANFHNYNVPIKLLAEPDNSTPQESQQELKAKGDMLVQKLKDFGVSGIVRAIQPGPVVTMFEYEPAPGTRVSKISSLDSDLALNMSAISVRIIAPIPGTNAVGIEMPNKYRATVFMKELLQSQEFTKNNQPLTVVLGKDSIGRPYITDIGKMPHLLVAGTTGSGKSVALNVMICSLLYKSAPDVVKFIMIDPKAVELSIYDGIPHMLAPVVTDPRLASSVLKNVATEMDRRYNLFKEAEVRSIGSYNDIVKADGSAEPMPYIVVIVDEFADLMMVAGKDVENSIIRIAQKARAAGIHLIIATQRPDANVITGLIRSNMPARLGLRVSQKLNSRIILDQNGAETLLGRGDSLFLPPGASDLVRVHGAFLNDEEVRDIVKYLKTLGEPEYDMSMVKEDVEAGGFDDEDEDPEYERALAIARDKGTVSISMIQRQLRIGYNKAARIVETMERRGIVAPSDGTAKPREVIG